MLGDSAFERWCQQIGFSDQAKWERMDDPQSWRNGMLLLEDKQLTLAVRQLVFGAEIETLHRCSLRERGQQLGSFPLQSVVLEYATEYLIAEMTNEIQQSQPVGLSEHELELVTVKE